MTGGAWDVTDDSRARFTERSGSVLANRVVTRSHSLAPDKIPSCGNTPVMNTSTQQYVVGFILSPDRRMVILIEKRRPSWQVGLLNGIGGHVEYGEEPLVAMIRECREECGLEIADWRSIATIENVDGSTVWAYATYGGFRGFQSTTDEQVVSVLIERISAFKTVGNIPLLLALAQDNGDTILPVFIKDTGKARNCLPPAIDNGAAAAAMAVDAARSKAAAS